MEGLPIGQNRDLCLFDSVGAEWVLDTWLVGSLPLVGSGSGSVGALRPWSIPLSAILVPILVVDVLDRVGPHLGPERELRNRFGSTSPFRLLP